jgi:hypothetical protein
VSLLCIQHQNLFLLSSSCNIPTSLWCLLYLSYLLWDPHWGSIKREILLYLFYSWLTSLRKISSRLIHIAAMETIVLITRKQKCFPFGNGYHAQCTLNHSFILYSKWVQILCVNRNSFWAVNKLFLLACHFCQSEVSTFIYYNISPGCLKKYLL